MWSWFLVTCQWPYRDSTNARDFEGNYTIFSKKINSRSLCCLQKCIFFCQIETHDTKSKITSSSCLPLRYWSVVALMIKYYHPIPFLICSVTMQTTTVTQNQCSHVEGLFPLGYQGYPSQIGRAVEITFRDCVTDWCPRQLFILIKN